MQEIKNILVIRFSAMGDVAMTVPVLQLLVKKYPQVHITMLSNAAFKPLFEQIPNLSFYAADLKGKHKGINGIRKLYKELTALHKFDVVADLHNVLRTFFLRLFFLPTSTSIAKIDKGRKEKGELTVKEQKNLHQLKTSHQRYADVFGKLGFSIDLQKDGSFLIPSATTLQNTQIDFSKITIAVAPFAKHLEKMYPAEKMKEVLHHLIQIPSLQILLMGGGKKEVDQLNEWQVEMPELINIAGKFSLTEELQIISKLNLMISMDSANMHLASLYNIPVVSIWGATHPFAGFYGWAQDEANIVQIDLFCRPCSVFGNKPCYRGDHACMQEIAPQQVVEKVKSTLGL